MTVLSPAPVDAPVSAFAKFETKAWPHRFHGALHIKQIRGGTPGDPKIAEGWIKAKLGATNEALLHQQIAEVVADRGVSPGEAVSEVNDTRHLNGFKRVRCPECLPAPEPLCDAPGVHQLCIEGRHLKAAIKEAACVAAAAGKLPLKKWGLTNKWIQAFIAEHVCVVEDVLPLGVTEPSGIDQRFVHTRHGAGIQYEEYVNNATIDFTVVTDHEFTAEQWAMIWLTGGQQGIGATRSQSYGRYTVTRWEPAAAVPARKKNAA